MYIQFFAQFAIGKALNVLSINLTSFGFHFRCG